MADNPTPWSRLLPWAEYTHNSLQNMSTCRSPFEAQVGYQPLLFPELEYTEMPGSLEDGLFISLTCFNEAEGFGG